MGINTKRTETEPLKIQWDVNPFLIKIKFGGIKTARMSEKNKHISFTALLLQNSWQCGHETITKALKQINLSAYLMLNGIQTASSALVLQSLQEVTINLTCSLSLPTPKGALILHRGLPPTSIVLNKTAWKVGRLESSPI